jgi:DNA-binding response OmpR family regulator
LKVYKVLLIEDEQISADIVKRILNKYNFIIDHVLDARIASQKVKQSYDIIILDLMMPILDGYNFIQRNEALIKDTPILVTSALREKDDIIKAASFKLMNYLTKPYEPEKLISKVTDALKITREDLVEKASLGLKINHEVFSENVIKLIITGFFGEDFKTLSNEKIAKLKSIAKNLKHITLTVSEEVINLENSVSLLDELLNECIHTLNIEPDNILLKGEYFKNLKPDDISKTRFIKKFIQ